MKSFKFALSIMMVLSLCNFSFSQTTIYTQTFGTTGTTLPTGWTHTGATTGWQIATTGASAGYTGASGGNYVSRGTLATSDTLKFSNVSTVGYTGITVLWGERRNTGLAYTATVQWSIDSITWTTMTFTDVTANSTWALVNGGTRISLPSGAAGAAKLFFRWIITAVTGTGTYRIDDFTVQGTQTSTQPPAKINIVSVNGGNNPDTCHAFNVVVQTVDASGIPSNVTSNALVTLTKFTGNGSGILSGGSGTITAGSNTTTISVTYSPAETGVSLLASCGTLITDTSSTFTVRPCLAHLPSCYAYDLTGGVTDPYPAGWTNYGLTVNTYGNTAANSGNFDTQGDSLVIHYNTGSDTVTFYLAQANYFGGGTYQFDVFESSNGLNYTTLHSFTTGLTAYPTWTGYNYAPLTTSRFIKFVYTTAPPAGPGGAATVNIDDICIKMDVSTPATAATANPAYICSGSSSTLGITGGHLSSGAVWKWYTGSCGGTLVASGPSPVVSPTSNTIYFVRAEGSSNTTSCVNADLRVNNERPGSLTSTPSSICSGVAATLNAVGGALVTGANFFWYTGSCGATLVGSGLTIVLSPTAQTTYFVRAAGACNTTACRTMTITLSNITAPSPVTATPTAVCPGSSSSLNATSTGNTIGWWDAATGGNMLGTSASATDFPVSPTVSTTYYAEAGVYTLTSYSFGYTGAQQTFTVPTGITLVGVDASGAQGGYDDTTYGNGGLGGRVQTSLTVTPGTTLYIYVGGHGSDTTAGYNGGGCGTGCTTGLGYYGGGGGGGTDIRLGGTNLTNRIIVAGGGGGAAYYTTNLNSDGGAGGGLTGGNGLRVGVYNATYCGSGGSQTAGGIAATYATGATNGSLGVGGASIAGGANGGGGGGGGFYGGGPGISSGGGGAGSSYVATTGTTNTTHTQGYQTGDGQLFISWYTSACTSTRTSITVTINTSSTVATALSASATSICTGNSVTLSETGGTLGGGANWYWYTASCGGTYLISGASVSVSPTVTTAYWARAAGSCNTTTCLSITVTVTGNTTPTSLTASPASVCGGVSSTLTETGGVLVSGSNWNWYSSSCGVTLVHSGATVTVAPTVTTTYWVRAEGSCNTTTCLSVTVSLTTPSKPTAVTATPTTVCSGTVTSLNATSAGNIISWWDSSTGGVMFGTSASAGNFAATPSVTTTYWAEAGVYINNTQAFSYTGSQQTFTVPNGINKIGIDAYGAQGGYHDTVYGNGGLGGRVQANLIVTPGQTIFIYVGGHGSDTTSGWNGGGCGTGCTTGQGNYGAGGGGATDIRVGGTNYTNRVIVAGGGGGAAYYTTYTNSGGGAGGGTTGGNGLRNGVYSAQYCGTGGSQTAGGVAPTYAGTPTTAAGSLGDGGIGPVITGSANGAGGGGGGYYGGSAGSSSGAGAGGSSYVIATGTDNITHTQGVKRGDGNLTVSWYTSACSSSRTSVTVSVNTNSTIPTSLSGTGTIVCASTSVTLSETGGTLGTGANWNWYTASCGGTYVISGTSATVTPSVTTVYWVRAAGTCNTTTCLSIAITIATNTAATAVTASPSSICSGISSTLTETGGTLVTGSNWNWFTVSCGGTYLISGSTVIVNPTVVTTYWVRAQGSCNTTTCLSVTVSIATSTTPTNVTATPGSVCAGVSTSLTATSAGSTIAWWSAATGGAYFGSSASGGTLAVSPTATTTYYAEAGSYIYNSQTFTYVTNSPVTWTVPSGLNIVTIDARGASGGYITGTTAGRGARMVGIFSVTPGQVLSLLVGQCPGVTANNQTYPGGGGGSFVALGSNYATATPLIVAGGGGASFTGTGVDASTGTSGTGTNPGTSGNGAPSVQCGGGGGGFYTSGGNDTQYSYYGGSGFQQGGSMTGTHSPGGNPAQYYQAGGTGGGAEADYWNNCNVRGGAGGGYSGGSGVDTTLAFDIGQGGGSYNSGNNQTNTSGYNTGNGQIIISWIIPGCTSTRVPVTVSVDSVSVVPTSVTATINCTNSTASLSQTGGKLGSFANWNWYTVSCGGTYVISGSPAVVSPTANTQYWVRAVGSCNTTTCLSVMAVIANTAPTSVAAAPATLCSGASSTVTPTGGTLINGSNWYWYTGSCGGTKIFTGSPMVQTPTITTTYWMRGEGTCTASSCLSVTITVNQAAVAPTLTISNYTALCSTNTSTISLSVSGGSGTDVRWYTVGCGTTSVGTGNPLTITHPTITTTYWGRWESTGCTSSTCLSIAITIFTTPAVPALVSTSGTNICSNVGGTITLSVSGGVGEHLGWYTVSCGTTAAGTGTSLILNLPTVTTIYWARWETATCTNTACKSVTVTIVQGPVDPTSVTSSSNTLCSNTGGTITLTSNGGSGTLVAWYTGGCGTTSIGTGSPKIITAPTVTSTYYTRWESGNCGYSNCLSTLVTVNTSPVAPSTTSTNTNNFCSGTVNSINLSVSGGSGDTLKWYTAGCGTTLAGGGHTLSLNAPTVTTLYYVRWESTLCGNSTCISLTVTVNPTPLVPTSAITSRNNLCSNDGGTISLTANGGSGTSIGWYAVACGTTLAGITNPLSISAPTTTTTYFVRYETASCGNSTCVSVTVNVILAPVAPTSATSDLNNYCSTTGGNLTLTSAGGSGTLIGWYNGSCTGTQIGTGSTLVILAPTVTTTYYTSWQVTGCNNSSCANVQVTVIQTPPTPTASANPTTINSGQSCTLGAGGNLPSGAAWKWYENACGTGTFIGTGSSLVITPTISDIYYVRGENGICISNCSSVIVSISGSMIGPGTVSANQTTICAGQSSTLTLTGTLNGGQWYWYSGSCGGIYVGTGSTLVANPSVTTTYYVRQEQGVSYSICGNVLVTVNQLSVAPTIISVSHTTVCSTTPSTLSISDGTLGTSATWNWYSGSCGGTALGVGISITINPTITDFYYVRGEGICNTTSCISANVDVIYPPAQPGLFTGNVFPTTGDVETYSVPAVSGVTYTWTAPSGWTGTSTTENITYTVGVTIGIVAVTPYNTCGAGPIASMSIGGYRISGYFTYDNPTNTPIDSAWVVLNQNSNKLDSIRADLNGYYEFNTLQNGTYEITATTHKLWSGVNSTDAVKVKRHFAGSELFTSSLRLHAADVNLSFNINTTDAVKITRRFVGSDTAFTRGDWVFEKPLGGDTINVAVYYNDTVIINNASVSQDFKGLCVGDVNGSNAPSQGAKGLSKLSLSTVDVKRLGSDQYFDLPLLVSGSINAGAISLILDFPSQLVNIVDVRLSSSTGNDNINYKASGNTLRIGWFESNGAFTVNNDAVLNIRIKTNSNFHSGDVINFKLVNDPLCEIADVNGETIDNVQLRTYSVEYAGNLDLSAAGSNLANSFIIFPNPAKDDLQINYNIVNDGKVKITLFNVLGEKIVDLINSDQLKGNYNASVNISSIPSGIYYCRIALDNNVIENKRIIISR